MHLSLGFSPCPNDTYIFDALVHKRIDSEGLTFDFIIEDVEQLNHRALKRTLDVTKLSYYTLAKMAGSYRALQTGSALGYGCGPLLISQKRLGPADVSGSRIGIPGRNTTAGFLLDFAFPFGKEIFVFPFSEIEQCILDGIIDMGVIIHENRFTYESKGLLQVMDLGANWEENTGYPIPLGGIGVRADLPQEIGQRLNRVIQASVQYAIQHPTASKAFILSMAQEMNEDIVQKHIALYVNDQTVLLDKQAREAIAFLYQKVNPEFPSACLWA